MSDLVERAHNYVANNAAESGADALIVQLADRIELRDAVIHKLLTRIETLEAALREIRDLPRVSYAAATQVMAEIARTALAPPEQDK